MKFIVIQNFSEAVDPEERKLRLHKVAKYSQRHLGHARKLRFKAFHKYLHPEHPEHISLKKQAQPHVTRYSRARGIIKKYGKITGPLPSD